MSRRRTCTAHTSEACDEAETSGKGVSERCGSANYSSHPLPRRYDPQVVITTLAEAQSTSHSSNRSPMDDIDRDIFQFPALDIYPRTKMVSCEGRFFSGVHAVRIRLFPLLILFW